MKNYQKTFIELAEAVGALKFGEFTLKSGRQSPYFFNAGAFCTGASLAALGRAYASAIVESGLRFDVMLGAGVQGYSAGGEHCRGAGAALSARCALGL